MAIDEKRSVNFARPAFRNIPGDHEVHCYYPAEGFGVLYHRTMLNDFFRELIPASNIKTVAEVPLDSYGIVGAGSLVFTQLGCKLTLVGSEQTLLDRSLALMQFNRISNVSYIHSSLEKIPVPTDTFDFSWSYERIQAVANPLAVLDELCRVTKSIMVVVPNKYNYGQYPHYVYHRVTRTTCDYVGPRELMERAPVREALQRRGMIIVRDGMIDVPWWPLFPELPNVVRRLIGRTPVVIHPEEKPEVNPEVIPLSDLPQMHRRVEGAAIIERSTLLPRFLKLLFAHSIYVIGCKPQYRTQLGL